MAILTSTQAAEQLGVSVRRVQQLVKEGRLPAERFGGALVIKKEDLKLVKDRKVGIQPKAKATKGTKSSNKSRKKSNYTKGNIGAGGVGKTESDAIEVFGVELDKSLKEQRNMLQILGIDCHKQYLAIQSNDSQMYRRAYVRSVLALIEGTIYRMKRTALHIGKATGNISMAEIFAIDEVSAEVNEKGEVYPKSVFIKFLSNIKFSFRVYSKSIDSSFELGLGGVGWQKLHEAVKVRDRLMHPKATASLEVTDEEVAATKKALDWFLISYMICSYQAQKAARTKSSRKHKGVAALDSEIRKWESQLKNIGN